jgi:hypothetical protein
MTIGLLKREKSSAREIGSKLAGFNLLNLFFYKSWKIKYSEEKCIKHFPLTILSLIYYEMNFDFFIA